MPKKKMTEIEELLVSRTELWLKKFALVHKMKPKTTSGRIRQNVLFTQLVGADLQDLGAAYIDVIRAGMNKK